MRLNYPLVFVFLFFSVCTSANAANSQEVLDPPKILQRLQALCDAARQEDRKPNDADLKRVRTQIRSAVEKLRSRLARQPKEREILRLDHLRQSLMQTGDFQSDAITETYQLIASPNEFDAKMTEPLSRLLRKYLTLELAVKNEKFSEEYRAFCEGIPKFVETFLTGESPEYGPALTDAMTWLSDLGDSTPQAGQIAAFLEEVFGHSNLLVQVRSDFLSHAFHRTIKEPLTINDRVLDSWVHGSGHIQGQTSMEFTPNDSRAQIRVLLKTQMSTNTVGRNGPVRVSSTNSGTAWGEKTIFLSEDLFRTTAARSSADITAHNTGIGADGCGLVQRIILNVAKNQVPKRTPQYNAESSRMAANRLSDRLNSEVDSQIAQLFSRYKKELREPLLETGLFQVPWKFRTTHDDLIWSAAVAASSQPGAASSPPELPDHTDLAVRVHQSALNNAAQSQLAGKRVDFEEMKSQIKVKYPRLAERIEWDEEDPLTAITFAKKSPVSFLFKDNLATIIIHIDRFEQAEQDHPGLDITIKYRMQAKIVDENGTSAMKFIFEKAEAPTAFPPGFDPKSGARIAGRNLAIRNIVMKRLDRQLKDTFAVSPMELEEQWKDKGLLIPQTIAADQGWFAASFLFR